MIPKSFSLSNTQLHPLQYPIPRLGLVIPPTMPHRPGEMCERCRKHIHPQTALARALPSSHSLLPCASCLPPGDILLTCGGCKLTRYCGKACQKAHRPLHKESCEDNIRIKQCARSFGLETGAMYASFSQWCEDNGPAFATAAFGALGIYSSSDLQNAYDNILYLVVQTDSQKDTSNKLRFTHSILLARKESRQAVHNANDTSMGSPETVDRRLLSPSTSVMRVILQNTNLPPPVSAYTLTFVAVDHARYPKRNPKWFEQLKNNVK